MKICKILASSHFLFKKDAPPAAKNFLHFRPTLSLHIFGLKLLRLLKLGILADIFPLISDMVLNF